MSDFDIQIFDRDLDQVCYLNDPATLAATVRHLAIGQTQLVLPPAHPKLSRVAQKGNRVKINFRGEHLFSGPLRSYRVKGTERVGQATLTFEDDLRKLFSCLAWIRPDQVIGSQNTGGFKEDKITDSPETVIKHFVQGNLVDRLGLPITVAPDLGRGGGDVTVGLRMMPPADKLISTAEQAGLGLTMKHEGDGFVFDVYEPRTTPHTLSQEGGTILEYEFGWDAPTATRTVIGNALEGTLREFRVVSDGAAEAVWGDVIEVFTSATDTEATAEMDARGQATLSEARATAGISVKLSESKHFRYGGANGFRVGDSIRFRVGGQLFIDVLRGCTLAWNKENGLQPEPTIGDWLPTSEGKMFRLIARAQRGLRLLQAR